MILTECVTSCVFRAADDDSLERAKKNIVRHYLVIGIEDEVKDFLWALEKLLPSYFEGIIYEVEYQGKMGTF